MAVVRSIEGLIPFLTMRINKVGFSVTPPGRWRRLGTLGWVATMIFIGGCETVFAGPSLYSTVPVTVTTRAGAPIPGVALELYTGQRAIGYATTDPAGQFTFERVPPGLYGVRAIPPSGYATKESLVRGTPTTVIDNLHIGADTAAPQRFVFLQVGTGSVTVTVRSTDGPLAPHAFTARARTK